jgi:hypothetical protein
LTTTPTERPEPENPAELLDDGPSRITADPLMVGSFVDGIQAALVVTYREHRPVYLIYVAAGGIDGDYRPVGLRETLFAACGREDLEWAQSLDGGLAIEEIDAASPIEIERSALSLLGAQREGLERHLVTDLLDQEHTPLVVDGSVTGREHDTRLFGVVKTTAKRYLADERVLFGLPAGWRSPRFILDSGQGVEPRYSAYLRMVPADDSAWDFGLIRVESFDPDSIDALCARCLVERQGSSKGDARWDRHMLGIRRCEEFLRSRRPWVFEG